MPLRHHHSQHEKHSPQSAQLNAGWVKTKQPCPNKSVLFASKATKASFFARLFHAASPSVFSTTPNLTPQPGSVPCCPHSSFAASARHRRVRNMHRRFS